MAATESCSPNVGFSKGVFGAKVLAHATAGGTLSVLQGGKFGHGFVSAGITEAAAPTITNLHSSFAKVAASAMVGGTVSELVGGKFGNGAVTGAFQMAFNQLANHGRAGGNESDVINGICEATYDDFDKKLGDLSLTPEYSLDFTEKVSSNDGPYQLSMAELKSVMDKDMAFLNIRFAKLGGAMNLSPLEFKCFSYAFGDGSFRGVATHGFIIQGRQFAGGDINYYYQGFINRAAGRSLGDMTVNIVNFNAAQALFSTSFKQEYSQVDRGERFARLGYDHYAGKVKW
jgi:hypothetical protein